MSMEKFHDGRKVSWSWKGSMTVEKIQFHEHTKVMWPSSGSITMEKFDDVLKVLPWIIQTYLDKVVFLFVTLIINLIILKEKGFCQYL